MKATTHQQDWHPTSHNNSIITNPRYLTITIRCLVELLKAGTYGLTCLDLLNRDNGQFWTDRLASHISVLRKRFRITRETVKLVLPDGRISYRRRYRIPDEATYIIPLSSTCIDAIHHSRYRCRCFSTI